MEKINRTGVKSFDHELESETFDYFTKSEREKLDKEFSVKILTKYSIYTWLLVLGVLLVSAIITVVCLVLDSNLKYLVLILAGAYIPLIIFIYNIITTTKAKHRYFLFINHKLKEEGFNDFYFRSYMPTLCYRLIIKDLLKKYGFGDKYKFLYDNFSTQAKISEYVTQEAIQSLIQSDNK